MTPVKSADSENSELTRADTEASGDQGHVHDISAVIGRRAAARAPSGVAVCAVVETQDSS
jgi:hypothetical protein